MPSRARDRIRKHAHRWLKMTPAERDELPKDEREKLEMCALRWYMHTHKELARSARRRSR